MEKNLGYSIFEAIDQNNAEALMQLLSNKPDLHIYDPNSFEDTPLHKAIRNGQILFVEALLKHNAPLEARNKFDNTPLHLAVMGGDKNIVSLLLESGADREAKNDNNKSALEIAIESNLPDIIELLKSDTQ